LGAVRDPHDEGQSDVDLMEQITAGTSLIYDAAAEVGLQHYL
jgi:hypothetical protein